MLEFDFKKKKKIIPFFLVCVAIFAVIFSNINDPVIGQQLHGIEDGMAFRDIIVGKDQFRCVFNQVRKEKTLIKVEENKGVILVKMIFHRLKNGHPKCKNLTGSIKRQYLLEIDFKKELRDFNTFKKYFSSYENNCRDGIYDSLLALERIKLKDGDLKRFFKKSSKCINLKKSRWFSHFTAEKVFIKMGKSQIHEKIQVDFNTTTPWLGWITRLSLHQKQSGNTVQKIYANFTNKNDGNNNLDFSDLEKVSKKYSIY